MCGDRSARAATAATHSPAARSPPVTLTAAEGQDSTWQTDHREDFNSQRDLKR